MVMPLRKWWGRLYSSESGKHCTPLSQGNAGPKSSRTIVRWNDVRVFQEETWTPDLASAEQNKSNNTKFKAAWIQCERGKKILVYQRILWTAYKVSAFSNRAVTGEQAENSGNAKACAGKHLWQMFQLLHCLAAKDPSWQITTYQLCQRNMVIIA